MKKIFYLIILLFAIACSSNKKKNASGSEPTNYDREGFENNVKVVKALQKGDSIQNDIDYINYRKRKMNYKATENKANCNTPVNY